MIATRKQTVAQYRIRNEAKWLRRSLERTFQVADTVVIFDDGSTDTSWAQAELATGSNLEEMGGWCRLTGGPSEMPRTLYWIDSPFADARDPLERTNEIRDKNLLWAFVKAMVPGRPWVLCLDGDEWLSQEALRGWDLALAGAEARGEHILTLPFIYLWDKEDQQRVDGLYGTDRLARGPDGQPIEAKRFRTPRLFSTRTLTPHQRTYMRFDWTRGAGMGFHCGSIPMGGFDPPGGLRTMYVPLPVVHAGYLDRAERERKYVWYNTLDGGNEVEGGYLHVVERPNRWCPGPPEFAPWEDR